MDTLQQNSNSSNSSPLLLLRSLAESGDAPGVLDLLQSGCAPLVADPETGQTALHLAAGRGHSHLVEALIQAGCDVGVQDFVSGFFIKKIWELKK